MYKQIFLIITTISFMQISAMQQKKALFSQDSIIGLVDSFINMDLSCNDAMEISFKDESGKNYTYPVDEVNKAFIDLENAMNNNFAKGQSLELYDRINKVHTSEKEKEETIAFFNSKNGIIQVLCWKYMYYMYHPELNLNTWNRKIHIKRFYPAIDIERIADDMNKRKRLQVALIKGDKDEINHLCAAPLRLKYHPLSKEIELMKNYAVTKKIMQ